MNYDKMSVACHGTLVTVIEQLQKMSPSDGIVDLMVTVTSYDEDTDSTHVVTSGVELCETIDDEWVVEEFWTRENSYENR